MDARNDFNGDGRSDILWRNGMGVLSWLGEDSGGFVKNAGVSGQVAGAWFVTGTGDFNGDGRDDVLWRNGETGAVQSWLGQDSGGFVNNPGVSGQVSANWFVAGTGDFNGDGHDDILWRNNETGAVQSWLGQDSGGFVNNPGVTGQVPTDWYVAGTGDFNGDGNDDILWRDNEGALRSWLGQDSGGFVNNPAVSGEVTNDWFAAGIGDFNGDGNDDLLWRNGDTGAIVSWLGQDSGGFVNNPGVSGQVPVPWFAADIGDFNGDGHDDVLWRNNDTGAVQSWLGQDSGGFVNNPGVSGHVDSSWQVQSSGSRDFPWWDWWW